ncbi:MAG: hypothetical protein Q8R53_02865 [Nanoarchaeota archaeon]|nr:hypothetical protein [Nanoarchaeota archaeon]
MAITYKTETEIPIDNCPQLAGILNAYWLHIQVTPEMMQARLQSGSLFVAAYDDEKPLGLLETLAFHTKGQPSAIAANYMAITNEGLWRPPEAHADTLLLVDITTDKETWNSGFGKQFIDAALDLVAQKTPYQLIFTYTPAELGVRRWHLKNGATETYHRITCARPGHRTEEVCLMEYTAEIARRRQHDERSSKPEILNPPGE